MKSCLGSQILAHVSGDNVFPGPNGPEYGFYKWNYINYNKNKNDPIVNICKKYNLEDYMVLSHGDTFTLPNKMILNNGNILNVILLAESKKKNMDKYLKLENIIMVFNHIQN